MNKKLFIFFLTILALVILQLCEILSLILFGTNVGNGDYPMFLVFFFPILKLSILYFSLKKIYFTINNSKYIFLKLFLFSMLINILNYLILYFLETIFYNYFQNIDPRKEAFNALLIEYSAPKFKIIDYVFIQPFSQTYYYMSDIKNSITNLILTLINFEILISVLVPLIIIYQFRNKKKNYS